MRYFVSIPVYASATYYIEAESEQEAIQKAFDEGLPNICHQCSGDVEISDFNTECEATAELTEGWDQ
jgi:hypothetical protein